MLVARVKDLGLPLRTFTGVAVELYGKWQGGREPDRDNWFKWIGDALGRSASPFVLQDDGPRYMDWDLRMPIGSPRVRIALIETDAPVPVPVSQPIPRFDPEWWRVVP